VTPASSAVASRATARGAIGARRRRYCGLAQVSSSPRRERGRHARCCVGCHDDAPFRWRLDESRRGHALGAAISGIPRTSLRLLGFRHLPVTDDGKLVELVTQTDLLRVSASTLLPNSREQDALLARVRTMQDIHDPERPDHPRGRDAARGGATPSSRQDRVLAGGRRRIGILTDTDLLRFVVQMLERAG